MRTAWPAPKSHAPPSAAGDHSSFFWPFSHSKMRSLTACSASWPIMFRKPPSSAIPMVAKMFLYPLSNVHAVEFKITEEITTL